MSIANKTAQDLWSRFQVIHGHAPKDEWESLLSLAQKTASEAFDDNSATREQAELSVHRVLYALYAGSIVAPWEAHWKDVDHYLFVQLRQTLEQSWNESEVEKYANSSSAICRRLRTLRAGRINTAKRIARICSTRCSASCVRTPLASS